MSKFCFSVLLLIFCLNRPLFAYYELYVLIKEDDSSNRMQAIDECAAAGADFGPTLSGTGQIDGCMIVVEPEDACGPVTPKDWNREEESDLPSSNTKANSSTLEPSKITSLSSALKFTPSDCLISGSFFALIKRGGCSFAKKTYEVQQAKQDGDSLFRAAIIYARQGEPISEMSKDNNYPDIEIPAFMISYDCAQRIINNYSYKDGYVIAMTARRVMNLFKYLVPFVAVIAFCFLVICVALVVRVVRERRRESRRRLTKSNLRKIPTKKYKKGEDPETCAICLDDFEEGEKLRVLPCAHTYHCKCVDPWLTKNRKVCPVCKRKVCPSGQDSSDSEADSDTEQGGQQGDSAPISTISGGGDGQSTSSAGTSVEPFIGTYERLPLLGAAHPMARQDVHPTSQYAATRARAQFLSPARSPERLRRQSLQSSTASSASRDRDPGFVTLSNSHTDPGAVNMVVVSTPAAGDDVASETNSHTSTSGVTEPVPKSGKMNPAYEMESDSDGPIEANLTTNDPLSTPKATAVAVVNINNSADSEKELDFPRTPTHDENSLANRRTRKKKRSRKATRTSSSSTGGASGSQGASGGSGGKVRKDTGSENGEVEILDFDDTHPIV